MRKKVLWVCSVVMPEFAQEFNIKPTVFEGWLEGMLQQLKEIVDIALCFPIIDSWRKKDGELNGNKYYSFSLTACEYSVDTEERFLEILNDYKPDVVHIWGTEYPHTLAMINACEEMGILDHVMINIQGLVEPCGIHYLDHVPYQYIKKENECGNTLKKEQREFIVRGRFEREALCKVRHVIGRTDWDCAWVKHINPDICYHFAGEILRKEFYEANERWTYEACEKHSIFVSQAGYPVKGLDYLLHVLPDIMRDYPDTHIYVAGINPIMPGKKSGCISPYGIYLRDLLKEKNLQDKISFLGQLNAEQMIERYLKANVFVSCSRIENSPNSVCEAALIGTPIVASFVGGVGSLASKISNIYLYQSGAAYMLAFYIKKIFEADKFEVPSDKIIRFMDRKQNMEDTWKLYRKLMD